MKLGSLEKQSTERESYTVSYEEALTAGDNVVLASAVVEPAGLTVDSITIIDPVVRFWATGGTPGVKHKVTLTVTTEDGRILEDEIILKIKDL